MQKYIGTKTINAQPMTRQEYNDLRGWTVPPDENPADEGYLVEYIDGGQANHPDYAGYISWSPKAVFERAYQAQPEIAEYSADDVVTEEMIKARGLNARRVSLDDLHDSIAEVQIIRHTLPTGNVLRFAVLILENGFAVTGRPSVSVSAENDNDDVGVKIAVQNAVHELWPFLGFKLVQDRHEEKPTAPASPGDRAAGANMTFSDALVMLKEGKRIARAGWNGKGMFVYLVPENSYPAQTDAARDCFGEMVPYNPYMAIKNVNHTVSTWVPSVNDALAEDWMLLD